MIKFVNAKINLGLNVLRKRPDGYHDLSTVFYPVGTLAGTPSDPGSLSDILDIVPDTKDSIEMTGSQLDCAPEDNLVWRALQLYRSHNDSLPPVSIRLDKHLPSQAGLGGGSADASFTLITLNELAERPLTQSELLQMALSLGADCPFFIINTPCLASGVGEQLQPIDLNLSGFWLAVVKPKEDISTGQAFKYVTPKESDVPISRIINYPIGEWRELLVNDFETSMFHLHPSLRWLKQYLYEQGALYASMSGSGSSFYGIYPDLISAQRACANAPVAYASVAKL
ncbi:MAG: 4-(cytidine 5'-diphospho)-2-C-methyl-D-erythritol kinase [Muribaculaceae bacterium]|nr:4-(cytidine 5'-diphospho)-2-C-methyl-D-erythritol kinase [Muribaculaceae bacterium]